MSKKQKGQGQDWFNSQYKHKDDINIIAGKKLKLKGTLKIKGFINLKSISLKGFELKKLEISYCPQLDRIIGLPELKKLKSLSVTDCPKLTLDCSNTSLTELEVSDLTELNCSNTSIERLSLNLCPNIGKLTCSNNNKLISLDVSNCEKLEYLDCSKSKLTNLDLSNCPGFIKVISENCPKLTINRKKGTFKNILVVGNTGAGKSTLANVITGTDNFKESAYAISETKGFRKNDFTWNEKNFRVVDTIGVGDTKLDVKDVLYKIADGILSMPEGISQVLFVTSGRFTNAEIKTYNTIKDSIFEIGILDYVTIVRTKFSNYRNKAECDKDIKKLREESESIREIIESCNSVIHVDNPSTNITDDDSDCEEKMIIHKNARKKSRKILLEYLEKTCQEDNYFRLKHNWSELHERILKFIEENNEDLENKLAADSELEAVYKASSEVCLIL